MTKECPLCGNKKMDALSGEQFECKKCGACFYMPDDSDDKKVKKKKEEESVEVEEDEDE